MRIRRLTMVTAVAALFMAALAANVPAQQVDPIHASIRAMGAARLASIRFIGFGAAYSAGRSPGARQTWPRVILKKYEADVDYSAVAMRVQLLRDEGPGSQPETVVEGRQRVWMTPHGFLRAAVANDATTRRVPLGTEISFLLEGQQYIGIVNGENLVDRVQTWVDTPALGNVLVEVRYRDYEPVEGGLMFPTHIIETQGSHVSLDVWVSSVRSDRSDRSGRSDRSDRSSRSAFETFKEVS